MNKTQRKAIHDKYGGRCAYCGCELGEKWHADHIEPVLRDLKWNKDKRRLVSAGLGRPENDNIGNLNPACISCNIQKNSFTVEQFRANIKAFVNSLNQYSTQYKFAKKYGLINETSNDVVFYFEKLIKQP